MPLSKRSILAGMHEVAFTLNVSASRAHWLANNDPAFPKVYDVLRATPVWLQEDITAYAAARNTRRGPPTGKGK